MRHAHAAFGVARIRESEREGALSFNAISLFSEFPPLATKPLTRINPSRKSNHNNTTMTASSLDRLDTCNA